MTTTSLDLSTKLDPQVVRLLRSAASVAGKLGVELIVAGAYARDMVLEYHYGAASKRATRDIDLALSVGDWNQYGEFASRMIQAGVLDPKPRALHRWQLAGSGLTVDVIPFGAIEDAAATVAWPPEFAERMSVLGYTDALRVALVARIAADCDVGVLSLPGLAFLKLLAWRDRKHATRHDAIDLALVLREYGGAMRERMRSSELALWESEAFDLDIAGARLLGRDIAVAMSARTRAAVLGVLDAELAPDSSVLMVSTMAGPGAETDRVDLWLTRLEKMRQGIMELP